MTDQKIELAGKLAEAFARSARKEPAPEVEDLNILPLPTTQDIVFDKWIRWTWENFCASDAKVVVTLYLSDYENFFPAGEFDIELVFSQKTDVYGMTANEAKALGQAIVSASNWHNVWKRHVGTFIERDIGIGIEKT